MECNKDEAIRAKEIAEKKMQINDFEGAQKIASKAKKLYPELENIAQILSICEIHCSAQKKLPSSESNWYEILQVEKLADQSMVKKQYRRLALILHPDKNRFPGAEAAFKLICEANALLSDPVKKSIYDSKIRGFELSARANTPHSQSNKQFGGQSFHTYNGVRRENQHEVPKPTPSIFSTCCPFCNVGCQYYRHYTNSKLKCPSCSKNFVVYEVSAQNIPPAFNQSKSENGVKKVGDENSKTKEKVGEKAPPFRDSTVKETRDMKTKSQKRGRKSVVESDDSFDADIKDVSEQVNLGDAAKYQAQFERKSPRRKNDVSYNEADEDGFARPSKRAQTTNEAEISENKNSGCDKELSSKENSDSRYFECPDPDFSDFDKLRDEARFSINQFWACYDDRYDGMPRFYAKVVKVFASPFGLQIKWLEAVPIDEAYESWVDEGLPVGCGNFELVGRPEKVSGCLSLSHQVHCETGKKKGSHFIYPREGEIWALFKDWDMNWSSNLKNHKDFRYEVVEILSDFDLEIGIKVCYLDKVSGFVSLFQRAVKNESNSFVIGLKEMYKFSHCIPSFKMSGDEREGVPIDSFELDPAALPMDPNYLCFPGKATIEGNSKLRRSPRGVKAIRQEI